MAHFSVLLFIYLCVTSSHGSALSRRLLEKTRRSDSSLAARTDDALTAFGRAVTPSSTLCNANLTGTYSFEQLIDHNNPALGTFPQSFYYNCESYKSGGPVVVFSTGDQALTDLPANYFTNGTMVQEIAENFGGAFVLFEDRFYGTSNPYGNLSTATLAVNTVWQHLLDIANFAENATLPLINGASIDLNTTPKICASESLGASYCIIVQKLFPGAFYAYYGSSALLKTEELFDDFYFPIQEIMNPNCSSDVVAATAIMDEILGSGNNTAIMGLLEMFGLEALSNVSDFAPNVRSNLQDFYYLQPSTNTPDAVANMFCDALEIQNGTVAGAEGWGGQIALESWGEFWIDFYYAYECGGTPAQVPPDDCLSLDILPETPYVTDTEPDTFRSYTWQTCTELGLNEVGPPLNESGPSVPGIISHYATLAYQESICNYLFPGYFGSVIPHPNVSAFNDISGGLSGSYTNTILTSGKGDPFLYLTAASPYSTMTNTSSQIILMHDAFHRSDMRISEGLVDASVYEVQQAVLNYLSIWLKEYEAGPQPL